jgi:hypothetical protein
VDEVVRSFLIAHLERWDSWKGDVDSSWDAKLGYSIDSVLRTIPGRRSGATFPSCDFPHA